MNIKKLFFCLIIALIACPAAAEIYKYVDQNGSVHFTDDFSNVPVEQRAAFTVNEEYEPDRDKLQTAEPESSDEIDADFAEEFAEDEESADISDETEIREDGYDSDGLTANEQNDGLAQDPEVVEDFLATSDETKTEKDLDAIRGQLDAMKKEINREYRDLIKQKELLAKEAKSLKGREEVLEHNKKVDLLNKKAELYAQKAKTFEARVTAYNEQIRQENPKSAKKTGTP